MLNVVLTGKFNLFLVLAEVMLQHKQIVLKLYAFTLVNVERPKGVEFLRLVESLEVLLVHSDHLLLRSNLLTLVL